MKKEHDVSVASAERIEDLVFQLHQSDVDPEAIDDVLMSLRRAWAKKTEILRLLDRLEAQYVTPFLLGDPELSEDHLEAIEAGDLTYNQAQGRSDEDDLDR